ncbi:transcription factor Adf-1-like [Aphis craccivora]|uniref:Transcription factor Adf-1-like n=1 Tax=Aphis craccivora TaxID=307492 RepID=A0A6G0VHR2_APHCR|nr:transcription factor Adf-1-like [Aphis craccivora]
MNEQKINLKMVEEVEKHPVLYNFTLSGYSRKDETEKAWSEVGRSVNMSVHLIKNKYTPYSRNFVNIIP